jgi:hypothetical protein
MALDVAADNTTESTDKVVDLAGRSATDSVSDTNTVNTLLVNSLVKAEKVDKVTSERVLGRESDLLALALDVSDDLNGRLLDVSHVLSVRVLSQVLRSANNDIDTVNAGLNSDLGIFHCASHVSEDLGLEAELADLLAVLAGLGRGHRAGELNVLDTKVRESLGNLDLGLCVKVGIGKLLSLSQGTLNDLEVVGVGEEVADRLVRQSSIVVRLVDGGSSPVLCDLDVGHDGQF